MTGEKTPPQILRGAFSQEVWARILAELEAGREGNTDDLAEIASVNSERKAEIA